MDTYKPSTTHVIFDCDGLLLDTESIYSKVYTELCGKYGHTFNWDIKAKMMGTAEVDSTKLLIDYFNLPLSVEEVISLTHQGYVKYFPEAKLLPGAEKLVRHLHSQGVPIAVATGSSEKKYNLKITHHKELFSLFSHVVFASDDPEVRQGKPCPDVFTVCAKRFPSPLPASPSNVLVFEDASNGVEAAVAAGMPCVLVPDVNLDITKVKDKAAEVLKSLEDFVPEKYGLPVDDLPQDYT